MKKESCCNKHSLNQIQMPNLDKLFGQNLTEKFRQFIMISFGLLFEHTQKIVDYTDKLMPSILSAVQILNLENSQNFLMENMQDLQEKDIASRDSLKLYTLIFKILKFLENDNISWSYAISKFLQIPIDADIQKFIKLYHVHSNDLQSNFKLDQYQQICECSILSLFVKHNVFFSRFIKDDKYDISDLFYELHVDENFKPNLCKLILIHFNHLYNPIIEFQLITNNNKEIQITLNQINYSANSKINEMFSKLANDKNIKQTHSKNMVERASLFSYFGQFMGHLILSLSNLYKESMSSKVYYMFDVFSNQLLQLPFCNSQSQQFCLEFKSKIIEQFYDDVVKNLFQQISEILNLNDDNFKLSPILPNNPIFNHLQQNSLLIYALTKMYPCQQTITTYNYPKAQEQNRINISASIHINILQGYRQLLFVVVKTWNDVYKQNKIGIQNIFRLVINYFLNNYSTSFKLKSESIIKNYLNNIVICDKNFITLLSLFLIDYNDSQEAYQDLLQTSGLDPDKFRSVMFNLLKRTLLNYIILTKNGNPSLYKGQVKFYKESEKLKEVSLEQVDVAYIQLYAFLFGAQGINEIISSYKEIAAFFHYQTDPSYLICRISQSDYDLIQCVGDMYGDALPEQFQKGLNKLFQTIFFARSFYQENDLAKLLKKFSYDSSLDLEKIILSSCELNQDNGQLQLKRSLLPVQYEPIFAQLVIELKEQITDKLKTQNDFQSELFGSSLANELSQLNYNKSTLTYKRLAILKAIVIDKEQTILQYILEQLLIQQEQGKIKNIQKILEDYSVYINLVQQCNKHLKNPNEIISQCLSVISQICLQILQDVNLTQTTNNIFSIFVKQLDESLNLNTLEVESDAQRACKSQIKKKQYLQKFNNMSQVFNTIIEQEPPTQKAIENCSSCLLQFENNEIQYRALLISYSNVHQHIHMIPKQENLQFDFFQIVPSSCQHTFHQKCLQKNKQKYVIGEFQYLRCPICLQPYNFPFVSPIYIQSAKDKILTENSEFFLQTLNDKKTMEYYSDHTVNNELNIPQLLDEIFSQVLCSLLFQLLSDLTKFKQKNTHLLLQDVMALLRIIYQQTQTTILEQILEKDNQILYKILKLILQSLIKQNNVNELKSGLDIILNTNVNKSAIQEALTQNLITAQFEQHQLPYDIEKISIELKQNYMSKFHLNFKDFLLQYYLQPCQKKSCKFLPLSRIENQELSQFICLICFKKMCAHFCGKPKQKSIGNLSRHCSKKHYGKTLYLSLKNSQILIMQAPCMTVNNNSLFKNLIGELPFIGNYQSNHYEKFNLNLKAIDQIIEIIVTDKFIHKLLQNTMKVQKTTL